MREYVPWDDDQPAPQSVREGKREERRRRENGNYDTSFSTHTDASAALVIFHLALPLPAPFSPPSAASRISHPSPLPPTRKIRGERNGTGERTKCVRLDSICGAEAETEGKKERKNGRRKKQNSSQIVNAHWMALAALVFRSSHATGRGGSWTMK